MPLYDFKCTSCQSTIQEWMSMQDVGKIKPPCPTCGTFDNVSRDWSGGTPHIKKYHGKLYPTQISKE